MCLCVCEFVYLGTFDICLRFAPAGQLPADVCPLRVKTTFLVACVCFTLHLELYCIYIYIHVYLLLVAPHQ